MSWMKRRGQPSPSPANPGVHMFNPNQHSNPQQPYQQWPQQQQQPTQQQYNNDWYNQPKMANKTPPLQPQQQQQQPNTTNNYWNQPQPPEPPARFTPANYEIQAQVYQPAAYTQHPNNQPQEQQHYYPPSDNYNNQQAYVQPNYYGPNPQQQQPQPMPISNHSGSQDQMPVGEADPWNWGWEDNTNSNIQAQNTVTDSFANDQSWNWSVEDLQTSQQAVVTEAQETVSSSSNLVESCVQSTNPNPVLDELPSLPAFRRIKSDNLTPQWSIESQVSQDSSEDVLLTSESDNRSNILSQSSSQSPSRPASAGVDFVPNAQKFPDEPANSEHIVERLQDLTLTSQFENKEIVSPELSALVAEKPQSLKEATPPPIKKNMPSDPNINPYKRTTALSHKMLVAKEVIPSAFAPSRSTDNGVNLETLPDNSERPEPVDNIPNNVRKTSTQLQWPENCEIAPINDRNQYLETGQLSDADVPVYNQSGNEHTLTSGDTDTRPPPGLRRLVLGQTEQADSSNQVVDNTSEPPPGLSRMVLGSTTRPAARRMADVFQAADYQNNEEPPAGLHRMVPGESSSPESTSYLYQNEATVFQAVTFDDGDNYVSETELNQLGVTLVSQRSATIGADTPPVTNQQSVSNTGYSSSSSIDPIREGAVGIDNEQKETDNTVNTDEIITANIPAIDQNRRDTIDGGPLDDQTTGNSATENHRNRNYTTDSEHEQPKERHNRSSSPGRYDKDRRYYDRRDRTSPDRYRGDRKYDRKRKDRRYEEDTDYYSDKERSERRHRDERDEYDRRYNSLRKDKDKRRGERREYDRDGRSDYYYGHRYEEDSYNRSRPSSRSDSMHDSYRDRNRPQESRTRTRDRDRDRDRDPRRPRDPYNPYYQGYNYDPYGPYYQQYQYYENLRRTNPQAYAEWYRKYYQSQGAGPHAAGYSTEDRASVHSGRSSANEDLTKDRLLDNTDSSLIFEDNTTISQRLTPAKFTTAHVKASIASGKLINILPHYPLDGQPATLELIDLQSLLVDDEEYKELSEFPGPLVKGTTHKKTVIEYCENKIKRAHNATHLPDVDSYILMWELLILLLRQNGMVVGTDIAELLMKNRTFENSGRQSISSASSSTQHIDAIGDKPEQLSRASPAMHCKEDAITEKFREYLIYGSGKEALEWAMKHGLWGHALFLASKLDKRTYANVMMRFANGLTMNDPLQTLYQLLSGRQPAAVTCVADEKWGDWRPHLAMILSNTTQRPDLDRKAITTLGDTLLSRGSLYAAHFCYLMAQVEFGRYGTPNVKVILLGASHSKPFTLFATNEAIFMTEIYEYACSLSDPTFVIPEFQTYKYLMATRMADYGMMEKGLLYLERVAVNIKLDRSQHSLVERVTQLADRLKYCDPVQEDGSDSCRTDSSWLSDLKAVLNDYNMGATNLTSLEPEPQLDQQWQQQQQQTDYNQQQTDYNQQPQVEPQQTWQPEQQPVEQQPNYQENEQQQPKYEGTYYQEQQFWNPQQQQQQQQPPTWEEKPVESIPADPPHPEYWNPTYTAQPEESIVQQPQISMPNQSKSKNYFEDASDPQQKPSTLAKQKSGPAQANSASKGWFGGIWSKLSLRPKNQMKLPDDKNPTIVWDSEKKRWVNLEEDAGETSSELKPPPKMADMFPNRPPGPTALPIPPMEIPTPVINVAQPAEHIADAPKPTPTPTSTSTQPNMFKLQRGRNIKKAYVDVFNSGATKSAAPSSVPVPEVFGAVPSNGASINYFVPASTTDLNTPTDFLTPQNVPTEEFNARNEIGGVPLMYNPNQFSNQQQNH